MSTALVRVRSRSEETLARFTKARSGESDRLYRGSVGSNYGPVTADSRTNEDSRAYERNLGWVYAALRPIEHRIAGLPWVVGRMLKSPEKKAYQPSHGRRMMNAFELANLPEFVRKKWGLPLTKDYDIRLKIIIKQFFSKTMHSEAAGFEIIESHPVLDVLTDPNARMIQHSLMAATVANLKITGKCYWWLAKSTRRDGFDIWPIPSHWVSPVNENGRLDEGWYFHLPFNSGDPIKVPSDRVVFFNYVDPKNPFNSLAPAHAGMRAIATDEMIQQSQQSGFENGIWPGLAVITGDIMSPEGKNMGKAQLEDWQIRQIEHRINTLYRGASKAKKLIVMDRVIQDIKEITRPNAEMDWMNSSTLTKARIFQIFGVNAIVAGEIEDANRATAVVADESFLSNVINPDACLIGEVANDHLMPIYEPNVANTLLWLEQARTHDPEQVRENVKLLSAIRGITVDEARAALGMPPMENGMGEVVTSPMTLNVEPADGSLEDVRYDKMELETEVAANTEDRTQEQHDARLAEMDREAQKTDTEKGFAPTHRYAEQWLKIHGKRERMLIADVEDFFNAQASTAAANYERMGEKVRKLTPNETAEKILPGEVKWTRQLKSIVEPHLRKSALIGAEIEARRVQGMGKAFIKADPEDLLIELPAEVMAVIRDQIRETLRQAYWQEITATSRAALSGAIQKAQSEGDNLKQTVVRIKKALGGEAAKIRAVTVARTETTNALNSGTDAVIDDLMDEGIATGKSWLATIDEHTRNTHEEANGQLADENGLYKVGSEMAPYPGWYGLSAKERANCILPDAMVVGDYVAAAKSFYSGIITKIITCSGRVLSVTPQHRILTKNGFVAACHLQKGDQVVSDNCQVDVSSMMAFCGNQKNNKPTVIKEVFESFLLSSGCAGMIKIVGAKMHHFHGDGAGLRGNIQIVASNRELLDNFESSRLNKCSDSIFTFESSESLSECGQGSFLRGSGRIGFSPSADPCSAALAKNKFSVPFHAGPLQTFRFGTPPDFHTGLSEPAKEERSAVTEFLREFIERNTGRIFLDNIIDVCNFNFTGHVYDLQSETGMIIANGICISNCRCTEIAAFD